MRPKQSAKRRAELNQARCRIQRERRWQQQGHERLPPDEQVNNDIATGAIAASNARPRPPDNYNPNPVGIQQFHGGIYNDYQAPHTGTVQHLLHGNIRPNSFPTWHNSNNMVQPMFHNYIQPQQWQHVIPPPQALHPFPRPQPPWNNGSEGHNNDIMGWPMHHNHQPREQWQHPIPPPMTLNPLHRPEPPRNSGRNHLWPGFTYRSLPRPEVHHQAPGNILRGAPQMPPARQHIPQLHALGDRTMLIVLQFHSYHCHLYKHRRKDTTESLLLTCNTRLADQITPLGRDSQPSQGRAPGYPLTSGNTRQLSHRIGPAQKPVAKI